MAVSWTVIQFMGKAEEHGCWEGKTRFLPQTVEDAVASQLDAKPCFLCIDHGCSDWRHIWHDSILWCSGAETLD